MSENLIKPSEILNDNSNIIVKTYLPFISKKTIIDNILAVCTTVDENGIKKIDYALKDYALNFALINNYTNVDFSEVEDSIAVYDDLHEQGIVKYILDQIPYTEMSFFIDVLESEIAQIHNVDNSIQSVIAGVLNKLIDKIPNDKQINKIIRDLPKTINKIDPEKLQYVSQAIGWNNGRPVENKETINK